VIDVQSQADNREIAIDRVGVRGVEYPITLVNRGVEQPTVASLELSVALPAHMKGTHMSRFVEVLEGHRGGLTLETFSRLVDEVRNRLDAPEAHAVARFPLFLRRSAPSSGAQALVRYQAWFKVVSSETGNDLLQGVEVPVTSLCPCSKAVSDYGAHNQRGYITIDARTNEPVWLEDLIEVAESSGSAPVYSLLKRADERHVTMQAYDNPVFVEDMVRNVASRLRSDRRVMWFYALCVNRESIHNHDAFAEVEWTRRPRDRGQAGASVLGSTQQ